MKVDKLHIRSRFKNLENIKVDFDEDHLMTVIVGRNGSGKSNVLEALVSIFRNLDLGEEPAFSYELVYQLGERNTTNWKEITIDADPNRGTLSKQYEIKVKGSDDLVFEVPFSKVTRDQFGKSEFLPINVFGYYSGTSNRLEGYFKKHRTNFYDRLLQEKLDIKGDIRPLFYARPHHSQFALLAFFLSNETSPEREFLKDYLGINSLDSIHFVLRRPSWGKQKNELFWGARGVVRRFLEKLIQHCVAPVKVKRLENSLLTKSTNENEFFHLFLPNLKALEGFAKDLSPSELFKMLEGTLLSDIISEVRIRVNTSSSKEPLTFSELSEGEQQLLTVLGLLKFTGGKDCLFLLDEPDTHLNPSWAVKYLKFLRDFVPNHQTSHLLMVTHHPLAIAELDKKQIQVMWKDEKHQSHAQMPEESPRGMGINLILRSDMFDMKTTLDDDTNTKLSKRNLLASKDQLTVDEEAELKRINTELDKLGFNMASDDPDYMDFLRKKYHDKKATE